MTLNPIPLPREEAQNPLFVLPEQSPLQNQTIHPFPLDTQENIPPNPTLETAPNTAGSLVLPPPTQNGPAPQQAGVNSFFATTSFITQIAVAYSAILAAQNYQILEANRQIFQALRMQILDIAPEIRRATLDRYQQEADQIKLQAMEQMVQGICQIVAGAAGGAAALKGNPEGGRLMSELISGIGGVAAAGIKLQEVPLKLQQGLDEATISFLTTMLQVIEKQINAAQQSLSQSQQMVDSSVQALMRYQDSNAEMIRMLLGRG